jgi:hypothetical protein
MDRERETPSVLPDTFVAFTPDRQDPSWGRGWVPVNHCGEPTAVEDLPQSAFLWRNFQVSVVFKLGGVDFSQSMARVPVSLLDFVLMLQAARGTLRRHGTAVIGLSDRGDQWSFSTHGAVVRLRIRGVLDRGWIDGSCPVDVFDQLVDQSLADALKLMFREKPALRRNAYLRQLAGQEAGG